MYKNLLLIAFVGLGPVSAAHAQSIEWSSGQVGGGWFGQAAGMAGIIHEDNPELNIRVVPGGGTANPTKVERDISQIGTGLDIFLKSAYEGTYIYDEPHESLRLLGMPFSNIYIHLVASEDAPYQDIETLFREGENVDISVTKAGSSDEQTFRYLMNYYGTNYEKLRDERDWKINHVDYSSAASQFGDGQVDYAFVALGIPGAAVIQMFQSRDGKILPIAGKVGDDMAKSYGYSLTDIPADTYQGSDEDVSTLVMGTTLMANTGMPDDMAYSIIKSLCEHQGELAYIHSSLSVFECSQAEGSLPAPLHTGVERYLEENGYL